MSLNRKVNHINQNVMEYWTHDNIRGWIQRNPEYFDDLTANDTEYVELRHNMIFNKHGNFGPVIIC